MVNTPVPDLSHWALVAITSAFAAGSLPISSCQHMQDDRRTALIQRYRQVTGTIMPALAKAGNSGWPVRNDHCFQRIILDAVCGGIWYDHIARPAYRHMSVDQAARAVSLCEDILGGTTDLADLNRKSLAWRAARQARPLIPTSERLL